MSYLEQKRNAIMNAVASGQLTNLLAGCTWLDGYFGGGGSIQTPTANKEKYCDEYIEVEPNHYYAIIYRYSSLVGIWTRCCAYNSSKAYNELITWTNNDNRSTFGIGTFRTNGQTTYLRFSSRTYGNSDFALVDMNDLEDLVESKITYENVTAQ